ncbi:MAG TPA: dihydroorotase [Verrucomicrobiales bacterium]|jgi:dihydroorotase|nr:dihydroorotase [Verrucomicrobiales bacterium]
MNLFLHGGEVATENGAPQRADVWIVDGIIKNVGVIDVPEGARLIDCTGKIVMPGMFDAHVHFREPGQEKKETILDGTEAAINGGITGVVMMPNTSPSVDSPTVVNRVLEQGKKCRIPVLTSACITVGRAGLEMAPIAGLKEAGILMLTDDGDAVPNAALLKRAMEYGKEFDMFFASHCEDPQLCGPRALNEGPVSYQLGIQGTPALAEEICMDRDIRLAHATGATLHIQHVSSAIGMETIRWWRDERGAKVSGEVSPHHLMFADEDIGDYDTHYKMNPPLRTREDNAALLQGLKDGVFRIIATDHAPHTDFEKSQAFVDAPNGITGLDTALVSLHDRFIVTGELGWDLIVKRYSAEPRRMMRIEVAEVSEGKSADLIVFDPDKETTFTKEFMKSRSSNTPFLDKTLKGSVEMVVLGDEILLER